jgi:putative intracellular protease/amidase
MVKVLCVLTSHEWGWYLPELAHPYFRFIKAGYEVTICSIQGGKAPLTPSSLDLNDAENKEFWENDVLRGLTENTKPLAEYSASDFDVVFFVGGFIIILIFFS